MKKTTQWRILNLAFWTAWVLASTILVVQVAMAGDAVAAPANDRWKAECASCHIGYPPQLLPAQAWRQIMSQLERHFGSDASMDAQTAAEIGAFLERHAATGRRARDAGQTLRITETRWFRHEHAGVKAAAHCAACHTTAEQGDFSERNLRHSRVVP
jgi:hypothetical protein